MTRSKTHNFRHIQTMFSTLTKIFKIFVPRKKTKTKVFGSDVTKALRLFPSDLLVVDVDEEPALIGRFVLVPPDRLLQVTYVGGDVTHYLHVLALVGRRYDVTVTSVGNQPPQVFQQVEHRSDVVGVGDVIG